MFQSLFQRAARKINGSREASVPSRPLPVAIPVPPSPPREPAVPYEAASSQRLPPSPPLAATGEVDWQPLPGGEVVGTGRVSVAPEDGPPFPGWQGWEGPESEAEHPGYVTEPEAGLPDWAEAYRDLDTCEQELTARIEELAIRGTVAPLEERERALLEQLCQERAGVLLQKLETDPVQTILPAGLDDQEVGDWFFREATAPPPRPVSTPAPAASAVPAPSVGLLMEFGFGVGPLDEGFTHPQVRETPPAATKPAQTVRSAARPAPAAPPRPAKSFRRRAG
jgi:hypothetical protein